MESHKVTFQKQEKAKIRLTVLSVRNIFFSCSFPNSDSDMNVY